MYYLRTRPAVNAIQYTVDKNDLLSEGDNQSGANTFANQLPLQDDGSICLSCSA